MSASKSLPDGWIETTFGEVVSPVSANDKKLPRSEYLEAGRFPVIDQGQQFIGGYSDDETKVISEDLPLLVFGDHTRAFKYLNQPFIPGADGIKVLKPKGVDPKWLYQIAHALDIPDKGYARHYQHLKAAKLFVPPLPEQRRIVAEIERQFTRLDAGVAALRRTQANLKRYRAAVLKVACEGRLVLTKTERSDSFNTYGPPNPLPKGWRWTTAAEICEQVVDCHNKTAPYTGSGIPLVRTTNIRGGKIDMSETRFVTQPTYEFWSRRCIPKPGDVLFTREAPMGEAGIIPDGVTLCMGQRMMLLRASPKILNRYLLTALITPGLVTHITRTAVGSGVKHLRVRDVESLPIPLPPLAEQTRIVAEVERRLSVVDELESAVIANLQRATRLRQSILHNSFNTDSHE